MNRRELLKFSLLSPLLGLLKKKVKPEVQMSCGDMSDDSMFTYDKPPYHLQVTATTGTSGEGPVVYYDGTWFYGKEMVKAHNRAMDEAIIKAIV